MTLDEGAASAVHDTDTTALNPMESARKITDVPIGLLQLSPTDPRTGEDPVDVSDLDIGEVDEEGRAIWVRTPLWVRTRDSAADGLYYEIIDGGRRYRKALSKSFRVVPCEVRDELTDAEIRTIQIVQNGQRRDLTPLQQAHAFGGLRDELRWSPQKIASRMHVDVRTVLQRLALLTLGAEVLAALKIGEGKPGGIGPAVALELTTVLDPEDQAEALQACIDGWGEEPLNARKARKHILSNYHLRLVDAPFDREADLVAGVPACGRCPKNSSLQTDMFALEAEEKAVCQDRACWAAKKSAWTKRVIEAARERGAKVIEGEEAKKIFPYPEWYRGPNNIVPLASKIPGDKAGRTFAAVLGDVFKPSMLVVGDKGETHELAKKTEIKKALVAAGETELAKAFDPPPERKAEVRPAAPAKLSPAAEARKLEQDAEHRADGSFLATIVAGAEKMKPDARFWRFLVALVLAGFQWGEGLLTIGLRRKIQGEHRKGLLKLSETLGDAQLRGLLVELLSASDLGQEEDPKLATWGAAGRFFKVDLEKLRKAEVEAAKKEAAAKAPAKSKAATKSAAAKTGRASKTEPAKAATKPAAKASTSKGGIVLEEIDRVHAPAAELEDLGPLANEDDTGDPADDSDEEDAGDPADDEVGAAPPAAPAPPKDSEAVETCKLCGCTDDTPCVDGADDACCWVDREHTLCSSCAVAMQSIVEQLGDEGMVGSAEEIFALVAANGEGALEPALATKALKACIAAGDVVEIDGRFFSGKLVKGVLALCTTPRTTPQVRAAFKTIPPAALVEALEVMASTTGIGGFHMKEGKWINVEGTVAPAGADSTALTGEERVLATTAKSASPAAKRAAERRKGKAASKASKGGAS